MVRRWVRNLGYGLFLSGLLTFSYVGTANLSYPEATIGMSPQQYPAIIVRCWDNCYITEECQLGRVRIEVDGEIVIDSNGPFPKWNWSKIRNDSEFLIPLKKGAHGVRVEVTDTQGRKIVEEKILGLGE